MSKESLARANAEKYYPIRVRELIAENENYSTPENEIALINNYISDPQKYGQEYAKYQAFREECKARARRELGLPIS